MRRALHYLGASGSLAVAMRALKAMSPKALEFFLALDHPLIQAALEEPHDKAGLVLALQGAFATELAALQM